VPASTTRFVRFLTAALAGLVALALVAVAPDAATATSGGRGGTAVNPVSARRAVQGSPSYRSSYYLCYGYANCQSKGMGNAGYAQANRTMYWMMYSGHNCTNYAAYRMVHSGLPNKRPWTGSGNAMYWGTSMSRITDGTPRVGAVAWWRANTGPAGSVGHVAYVEKIVSADEIIVSQDSWGGDFSWADITRASGNWPSGFIHFNDLDLSNTAAPEVTGTAKVGSRLTATPGTWTPGPVTVAYQWYAAGQPITGATAATYRLTRAVVGKAVTVAATASKPGYPAKTATSAPTDPVLPGTLRSTAAPTITGDPTVDQVLTLATGTWNPVPTGLTVQWLADGQPIPDVPADARQLTVTPALVGARISATVTASRAGYADVPATAAPTAPVAEATFTSTGTPTVSGLPRYGSVLSADPGVSTPTADSVTVQWLRDGQVVPGAEAATYPLTADDLGHRLAVVVTRDRAGYVTTTSRSTRTWRIKSDPTIHLRPRASRQHWVRVNVRLTAPGAAPATGPVTIRIGQKLAEATLVGGHAVVTIAGLAPGDRFLRVRYAGSDTVAAERVVQPLTVR
jgi:surface antigen